MEKTYRHLLLAILAVVTALGLAACGDNDDSDKDNEIPRDIDIVGTWKLSLLPYGMNGYKVMTFHPDGKFSLEEIHLDEAPADRYGMCEGTYRRMYNIIQMTYLKENGYDYDDPDDRVVFSTILSLSDDQMLLRNAGPQIGDHTDYTDEDYAVWDRVSE